MNQVRANSSPDLTPPLPTTREQQQHDDSALEGVAANIKLLLKLTQDHKEACAKEKNDTRRTLRVATMLTILDNVRDRIQKSQSFGNKKSEAELRRCNTDLRPNRIPRDKKHAGEPGVEDEKDRLRRELSASMAACKSLQVMCSSLGKEKGIMVKELSKKVHELSEMEELVCGLKAQNETLLHKVQEYASICQERRCGGAGVGGGESQGATALQERNKALSEQLLRSVDGYRSMKRKLKVAQEENAMMHATMSEIAEKVGSSLERIRSFKERMLLSSESDAPVDVREEILASESMFEQFQMLVMKYGKKPGECSQPKGEFSVRNPSVLAREKRSGDLGTMAQDGV